jgi:hypothetical protein
VSHYSELSKQLEEPASGHSVSGRPVGQSFLFLSLSQTTRNCVQKPLTYANCHRSLHRLSA